MQQIALAALSLVVVVATTGGCAMSEEMRRIEQMQKEKQRREKQMTTDLSGEQIFIRSCNSCHPGGKAGMGPALDKLSEHFPNDEKLKKFIRQGVGAMPPQPKDVLDDQELANLIYYLRNLKIEIK
jgi:cytochrome c5